MNALSDTPRWKVSTVGPATSCRGNHASFRPPPAAPPSRGARSPSVGTPPGEANRPPLAPHGPRGCAICFERVLGWSSCPVPKAKTALDPIDGSKNRQAENAMQVIVSVATIAASQQRCLPFVTDKRCKHGIYNAKVCYRIASVRARGDGRNSMSPRPATPARGSAGSVFAMRCAKTARMRQRLSRNASNAARWAAGKARKARCCAAASPPCQRTASSRLRARPSCR